MIYIWKVLKLHVGIKCIKKLKGLMKNMNELIGMKVKRRLVSMILMNGGVGILLRFPEYENGGGL